MWVVSDPRIDLPRFRHRTILTSVEAKSSNFVCEKSGGSGKIRLLQENEPHRLMKFHLASI
jgi:hypothetical protein